ncbi:coiled-coil domain-containing protein 181-like, partial [Daktulosphaira vitifoliae]|uniref:coiled-coil domain-containing protein 181-like n=1 Tax=Daktulosphaira vitifoliae TaxID=58002 RepID=UPI0021AAEFC6
NELLTTNDSNVLNECNGDDEEDFIKIYFASGTVLKPSQQPYDLRLKIVDANRQLKNDIIDKDTVSVLSKVKFDNTVVVLDSFEDIGTISIGTERLRGSEERTSNNNVIDLCNNKNIVDDSELIIAKVDLMPNTEEDDQNDVVICPTIEKNQSTQQEYKDNEEITSSSVSFSRSFSSDSEDPPFFVNIIESDNEVETILNRVKEIERDRKSQRPAIDEQVENFPELFTHSQYKLYENSSVGDEKNFNAGDDDNIYVPKKLDPEELRNRLRDLKKDLQKQTGSIKSTSTKGIKQLVPKKTVLKKVEQNRQEIRPPVINRNGNFSRSIHKPQATYYFELDSSGKLKPLNKNKVYDAKHSKTVKFFHINLKAAKSSNEVTKRTSKILQPKSTNSDLFLEFQTDISGNKGAQLVIKKKPADSIQQVQSTSGGSSRKSSNSSGGSDRLRLPDYNGLRSEYGLSAEQLLERRRLKTEREQRRKEVHQKKIEQEQKRRIENEKNFSKWLQQKKQQKKQAKPRHCYPLSRLTVSSARTSIKLSNNGSYRKGSFALEELLKIKDNKEWLKL